jgi:hypothetical protein
MWRANARSFASRSTTATGSRCPGRETLQARDIAVGRSEKLGTSGREKARQNRRNRLIYRA